MVPYVEESEKEREEEKEKKRAKERDREITYQLFLLLCYNDSIHVVT